MNISPGPSGGDAGPTAPGAGGRAGVAPPKTAAVVAAVLRSRIAHRELVPGDRLAPEDGLMEEFGLARTTLREALRILESEGIIAIQRGRGGGPRVVAPSIEPLSKALALQLQISQVTLEDLDAARRLIEPHLAAVLAANRSDDDLQALRAAIARATPAAEQGDPEAFAEAATAVHETIAERAGNTTLGTLARMLHDLVAEYYRLAAGRSDPAQMQRAVRSYRRLHDLIERRDVEGAAEHWRAHMAYTIDRIDRHRPLDVFPSPNPADRR